MPEPTKLVHFFEIQVQDGPSRCRAERDSWEAKLQEHVIPDTRQRAIELTSGTKVVVVRVDDNERQMCIGRVIDGATGLQRGDWVTGRFRPVEPESKDDFFTRVTYVQFVDGVNAVGVIGGVGEHPSRTCVERVLNAINPLESGKNWVLEPITQPGQLERAKASRGFRKIEFRTRVRESDLFGAAIPDAGAVETLDMALERLAHSLGSPLRINVRIAVEKPADHPMSLGRLKSMLIESRNLLADSKKILIETTDALGSEIFNLIEHKMTATISLPEGEVTGGTLEEAVLMSLQNVCDARKNEVNALATQ